MKSRWTLALVVLLTVAARLAAATAPLPSLDAAELARGPFSNMHMLLEKTFLKIDVATIDVRVGKRVQGEFSRLASGKRYSDALEAQLARAALQADHALIQLTFVRDVPLGRWIGGVRDSLEKASEAGLIAVELRRRVSEGLPEWFRAIEAEGFQSGDRVLYEIRAASLRTLVVTRAGKVLVDRSDKGDAIPRLVLASYFAPDTDYRTPLLTSLIERQ
ncbi:MAG: hypothetical protein ABI895_00390 [Deltaproteobacteria bacterium]